MTYNIYLLSKKSDRVSDTNRFIIAVKSKEKAIQTAVNISYQNAEWFKKEGIVKIGTSDKRFIFQGDVIGCELW